MKKHVILFGIVIAVVAAGVVALLCGEKTRTPPAGVSAMFVKTADSVGEYGDYFGCGQIVSFSVDGVPCAFWVTTERTAEAFESKREAAENVQLTLPCIGTRDRVRRIGTAPVRLRWLRRADGLAVADVSGLVAAAAQNGAKFESLDLDHFAAKVGDDGITDRYAVSIDPAKCVNDEDGDAFAWTIPFVREAAIVKAVEGAPLYAKGKDGGQDYFFGIKSEGSENGYVSSREVLKLMVDVRREIASGRLRKAVEEAVGNAQSEAQKRLDRMQKSLERKDEFIKAFDIFGNYAEAEKALHHFPTSGYTFKITDSDGKTVEEEFTAPNATMNTTLREPPTDNDRQLLSIFGVRYREHLAMGEFAKRGFKVESVEFAPPFDFRGTVACTREDAPLGFGEFVFGVKKDDEKAEGDAAMVTCCDVCGIFR